MNVENLVEIVNTRSIFASFQHFMRGYSQKPCRHAVGSQHLFQQVLKHQKMEHIYLLLICNIFRFVIL